MSAAGPVDHGAVTFRPVLGGEVPITQRTVKGVGYKVNLDPRISERTQDLYRRLVVLGGPNAPEPTLQIFGGGTENDIWYVKNADGIVRSGSLDDLQLTAEYKEALNELKTALKLESPPHLAALRPASNMLGYVNISLPWFQGLRLRWKSAQSQKSDDLVDPAALRAASNIGNYNFVQALQKKLHSHDLGDKYFAYGMYKALELKGNSPEKSFEALKAEHGFEKDTSQDAYFHEIVCLSISDKYNRLQYMEKHGLQVRALSKEQQLLDKAMSFSELSLTIPSSKEELDRLPQKKDLLVGDMSKILDSRKAYKKALEAKVDEIVQGVFPPQQSPSPLPEPEAPNNQAAAANPKPEASRWDLVSCLNWWAGSLGPVS